MGRRHGVGLAWPEPNVEGVNYYFNSVLIMDDNIRQYCATSMKIEILKIL